MGDLVTPFFPPGRNRRTFRDAAISYIHHGGEDRYLGRIVEYLGSCWLDEIAPFDLREMATSLYDKQSNATRNRCALAPARAVMSHAYDRGWAPMMRIRAFKVERPRRKTPASAVWMFAFLRQCRIDDLPHLGALVLFMHHTGARVSEAIRLDWPEVDLVRREALLLKTKTGTFSKRGLTDELVARIGELPRRPERPVFNYRCRFSVNERIRAVCERAEISYKSAHLVGRHSFATNALAGGMSIPDAMEAGDWKSVEVFCGIYVHTVDAVRTVADHFSKVRYDAQL